MNRYQIVGQKRIAAFIAQVGHESVQLTRLEENLSYSASGLANTSLNRYADPDGKGVYVKVMVKVRLGNKPNTLGLGLAGKPELMQIPQHGYMATAWFWFSNGLNSLADKSDIDTITRCVNGGLTGLADRQAIYARALKVLV